MTGTVQLTNAVDRFISTRVELARAVQKCKRLRPDDPNAYEVRQTALTLRAQACLAEQEMDHVIDVEVSKTAASH